MGSCTDKLEPFMGVVQPDQLLSQTYTSGGCYVMLKRIRCHLYEWFNYDGGNGFAESM